MERLVLISCIILSFSLTISPDITYQDVYICNSKNAKKYHLKKNCRGLSACKADIKKLSLEKAKNIGKTLCGWED